MEYITKRVRGSMGAIIPKYNIKQPAVICDTADFFEQLKNIGYIIEDVEKKEETTKEENKKTAKEETTDLIDNIVVNEQVNIAIEGGMSLELPSEASIVFEGDEDNNSSIVVNETKEENQKPKKVQKIDKKKKGK